MAKNPVPAPNTAAASVTQGAFAFDNLPLPPNASRRAAGAPSELSQKLAALPVGLSFLEEVKVPETVAESERDAVFKEKARSAANRVSGAVRRFKKSEAGQGRDFKIVTVNDDTYGHGVRVWRFDAPAAAPETATA